MPPSMWDLYDLGLLGADSSLGADHPLLVAVFVLGLVALLVVSVATVIAFVTTPKSPEDLRVSGETNR